MRAMHRKLKAHVPLLSPSKLGDEKKMFTLNKKELQVLDETETDYSLHIFEIEQTNTRWWRMEVHLENIKKMYEVVTVRGEVRHWKNLDIAVDFIKENCPRTNAFMVFFKDDI
jgi:hypothetical protein